MRRIVLAVPALLLAGFAAAQEGGRPSPLDPAAKAPPVQFRSAMDGYKPFAEQELRDWRKSNDAVRDAAAKPSKAAPARAGGHAGHHGEGARK